MRNSTRYKNRALIRKTLLASRSQGSKTLILAENPQPWVLREYMESHGIKHEETVTVNLSNVRVKVEDGQSELYFCPMKGLEVVSTDHKGDSALLPEEVTLPERIIAEKNLRAGFYNINGIVLHANGTIQVRATAQTEFKLVKAD